MERVLASSADLGASATAAAACALLGADAVRAVGMLDPKAGSSNASHADELLAVCSVSLAEGKGCTALTAVMVATPLLHCLADSPVEATTSFADLAVAAVPGSAAGVVCTACWFL